ncbi:MAG: exonuclease subunit SbcD, partial [Clostridia bacterium]|nr:exonuclease subunit SbcD [Clostridia bacterium]
MKILHTSDWHLGAKTDRRNRIDEQARVMGEITMIADENDVDIVIVSGDVYDNAVPTSEAEELFFNTIEKLSANNNRMVIVLAGNHDDPKRLSANRHFARKHNIVLAGDFKIEVEQAESSRIKIAEIGTGYIALTKGDGQQLEKTVVGILPYPVDYRLNYKTEGETYNEKVKEWAKLVSVGFKRNAFNILATHLTLVGSETEEDSEFRTVKISEAGVVKKSDLPKADYYALGHIHSCQNITDSMCYSGAPI